MRHGAPITQAYHDEDVHGWQFYSDCPYQTKEALIVSLKDFVALDRTIEEIPDLPPG